MSNERRSVVEMTDLEIMEEVSRMFNRSRFLTDNSFEVTCRRCYSVIVLDEQQHRYYQNNNLSEFEFTLPTCAECRGVF